MRISDWSSDVCSSDLRTTGVAATTPATVPAAATALWVPRSLEKTPVETASTTSTTARTMISTLDFTRQPSPGSAFSAPAPPQATWSDRRGKVRSEEHTSELQSLMRISYAVFCLKKKKNNG